MAGRLIGRRVVVTRTATQAREAIALLAAEGAEALVFPCIAIADVDDVAPVDAAIAGLGEYDWIVFTSANAVVRFFARMDAIGVTAEPVRGVRVAAVGPATAGALEARGVHPDLVPEEHVGEGLARALLDAGVGPGSRVLLPRALEARDVLPRELEAAGATVDVVPVYRTVTGEGDPAVLELLRRREADAVIFTSASTVRGFVRLTEGIDVTDLVIASIGPITSRELRARGMRVDVEPAEYTVPALIEALAAYLG